ncbi:hypothetical protein [Spongiactinospora sp. TRM90649]|uniref:hypothetical protein n=1 Tax=Spongiactinospora sp. TRM90649 TaxID=3031114 RepID=UPI0023F73965|nr:hypothetical protein [Spongiactinospora sp. TRM90649]MDF5752361.1 hypothetical protein [Spongiactinospora sp. TRM90649]
MPASVAALAVFTVFGSYAVVAPGPGVAAASAETFITPGAAVLLLIVIVIAAIVVAVSFYVIRGVQAERARADRARDEAVARAQFLAAALEPESAMRLLGYGGTGPYHPPRTGGTA